MIKVSLIGSTNKMIPLNYLFASGVFGNGKPHPEGGNMAKVDWNPKKKDIFPRRWCQVLSLTSTSSTYKDRKRSARPTNAGSRFWLVVFCNSARETSVCSRCLYCSWCLACTAFCHAVSCPRLNTGRSIPGEHLHR